MSSTNQSSAVLILHKSVRISRERPPPCLLTIELTINDQQMVAGPAVRGTFAADTHAAMRLSLDTRQHTNSAAIIPAAIIGKAHSVAHGILEFVRHAAQPMRSAMLADAYSAVFGARSASIVRGTTNVPTPRNDLAQQNNPPSRSR
jgi:hypothetical protein